MKKISLLLVIVLSFSLFFVACNSEEQVKQDDQTTQSTKQEKTEDKQDKKDEEIKDLEGEVTISGSTSVEKVMVGLAEEFMALNPGVEVTYEAIGSSGGVKNSNEGVTMIGTASRNLKEAEIAWGLKYEAIAYDGIAVITHPENTVTELTLEQVSGIYKGEITNWSEVGGKNEAIVVVSREDGSGTRGAFEEIVDFEGALTENALLAEGNGNVQTTVAGNPNAIGYVSFTYINDTVQPVKIEGEEPTIEKVLAEAYPIARPFMITYHEENLTDEAKAFMKFIFTADGQSIVSDKGGIPVAN